MRIEVETDVETPARDGTLLRADIYRPAGGGALPTLVRRTPYDKSLAVRTDVDVLRLVRAGYAVVVQDVRGRYASEGRFEPFRTEASDGADAVAWAAAQPWSSGAVGMVGASYEGMTQWLAASAAPPALRAIAPLVTSVDPYDGWAYQGGAFELGFGLLWNAGNLASEPLAQDPRDDFEAAARRRPLRELAPDAGLAGFHRDWLGHPGRDGWWEQLVPPERVGAVAVPALSVGGWYDLFLRGTLAGHSRMRAHANGSRLVVGPWSHMVSGGVFPQRSYGWRAAADAVDLTGLHLRWFDRHLRGVENGVEREPAVRLFVMGADRWRDADDWPLPGTAWTRFHLGGGGALSAEAPGAGGEDAYRYDPRDPVPTAGGATFLPGQDVGACAGPLDQRAVQRRADVLVYRTPPLERDVEVIGPVELVLYVSSSAVDTDFTGKLVDVHPDGRAELLTDGILRARWRESQSTPVPLVPGRVYELRVDLGATANVFRVGHRIGLEISSSNFPRFDRNTNTGGTIADEREEDVAVAVNRVHHGRAHPSHLMLPAIPAAQA
ncbi:X-Pro dipeptidyl-peptidase domain protein [Conexibacter woesei DSM 14684]|uniref:X-Pro dipeptidyl-peptidase domain protein n=2 Tax=Conexibacter TaxID=191494 RepID=D3F7C6_CONWI|nr:X-Pro dipeptidyl-peptidase domain protein [Conexibacter woesei DSM 14684]